MITRSLQKKYIVAFFTLGILLSCILCLVNSVLLTTKMVNNYSNVSHQYINLTNHRSNESNIVDFSANNIFRIDLPRHIPDKFLASDYDANQLNMQFVIVDIKAISIFGNVIPISDKKISTTFIDLIKVSQFFQVTVNKPHLLSKSNRFNSILYVISISFGLSLLVLISLFIIDNLFALFCSYFSKLTKIDTKIISKIELIISICSIVMVVGISCIMCNVGIMHTDDGFFNLMAIYPQDVKSGGLPSTYNQITHLFLVLVGGNIFLFRLCTVILSLLSISVLLITVIKFLRVSFNISLSKVQIFSLFALLIVTNNFQYIHHLTPDYNNLSRVIIYAQVSIILLSLIERRYINLLCLVLGVLTGINIFIKITESLASTLIIFIILYRVHGNYFRNLLSFIFGIFISILAYLLFIQSWSEWYKFIIDSLFYSGLVSGHNFWLLIFRNSKDIIMFILYSIFILFGYIFLMIPVVKRYNKEVLTLTTIFFISLITIYSAYISPREFDLFKFFPISTKFLLLTLVMLFYHNYIISGSVRILKNKLNHISMLMLIFTYIASIGTDTPIIYHILFHPAFIVIAIILQLQSPDISNSYKHCVVVILLLTNMAILIKGSIYNSAMYVNLLQENKLYNINEHQILISDSTYDGLINLKRVLTKCGYKNNDYIAGYYGMPEIIFALGGRSPVTPWYLYSGDNSMSRTVIANNYLYSLMTTREKQNLFILFDNSRDIDSLGLLHLQPHNYCGVVDLKDNPEFRIKKISIYHITSQ